MEEKNRYYVVTKKAVPEVLLKVVEAGVSESVHSTGSSRYGRHQPQLFL